MKKNLLWGFIVCIFVCVSVICLYVENQQSFFPAPEMKMMGRIEGKKFFSTDYDCNPFNLYPDQMSEYDHKYMQSCLIEYKALVDAVEKKRSQNDSKNLQYMQKRKKLFAKIIETDSVPAELGIPLQKDVFIQTEQF